MDTSEEEDDEDDEEDEEDNEKKKKTSKEDKSNKKAGIKVSSSSKGFKGKQDPGEVTKRKSNTDSGEKKKEPESGSDEEISEDEEDKKNNSQLKEPIEAQVRNPVSQEVEDSEVNTISEYIVDEDSGLQERNAKVGGIKKEAKKETKKETKKGGSSNYQNIETFKDDTESICQSIIVNTDVPPSPDSNATVEVWKDHVKKLKDFRDALRRKNERTEENIGKIKEKSERLKKELKELDNNDALFSKIASLLTEKRNEMRQSFTCI